MAKLGGQGWDANVGVRLIRTEQTASGNILGGPAPTNESPFRDYTPLTVNSAYTDVLPSVNLGVHVTDHLVARLAPGRTDARRAETPRHGQTWGTECRFRVWTHT